MALAREVTVENVIGIEFTDCDDSVGQMGGEKGVDVSSFLAGETRQTVVFH